MQRGAAPSTTGEVCSVPRREPGPPSPFLAQPYSLRGGGASPRGRGHGLLNEMEESRGSAFQTESPAASRKMWRNPPAGTAPPVIPGSRGLHLCDIKIPRNSKKCVSGTLCTAARADHTLNPRPRGSQSRGSLLRLPRPRPPLDGFKGAECT